MKTCTVCHRKLSSNNFCRSKRQKDGLHYECRECVAKRRATPKAKARKREIEKTEKHREWLSQYRKERYASDAEWRGKINTSNLARYHANYIAGGGRVLMTREEKLARRRAWQHKNREKIYAAEKLRRQKNREHDLEMRRRLQQKRTAKSLGLIADLTQEQWDRTVAAFNNGCAYCGAVVDRLAQDHFVPQSKGGGYTQTNIVPACLSCNSQKHDDDPVAYLFRDAEQHGLVKWARILEVLNV